MRKLPKKCVCVPVGSDVFIARTHGVQVAGRADRIFKWAISAVKAFRSLD